MPNQILQERFPQKTLDFLKKLKKNNTREWFEANRSVYEENFLAPAQELVMELGEKLKSIAPGINAIPNIDKSIFRIHRDIRFGKDKSPYKTNMGLLLWEGAGKKMESSGFYMHLEPGKYFLGAGIYMLSKEKLKKFRDAVVQPEYGKELLSLEKKLGNKGFSLYGEEFKRYPKGYDPDLPQSKFLLYNGIFAYYESTDLSEIEGPDGLKNIIKKFKDAAPMHQWIMKAIESNE